MRTFPTVYMRGGTSKGCFFLRDDLPEDQSQWDSIFLQTMGSPDPKQIDGLGGCVSTNNKIVVVWKSQEPGVDVEYLIGQVIVGKNKVDYRSNCGNMTSAVGPFAVEEGLVTVTQPITTVHLLNRNTNKYIDVTVPIDPATGSFASEGTCAIAGVDGTAAELWVHFLDPAGAVTGKLLPTGKVLDTLNIPGFGPLDVTILDVSNPMVLLRAKDLGLQGSELPDQINGNATLSALLETIRGTVCCHLGLAADLEDASRNSAAVPKIGFVAPPMDYADISGDMAARTKMDLCARVISVFQCHKACPLTSACAISAAAALEGSLVWEAAQTADLSRGIRIGHPSGIMTMLPDFTTISPPQLRSVAVQRTARRIMDGTLYIRK